jgi:leader peptidase (prepilin peptidase)/N-methyltransferase
VKAMFDATVWAAVPFHFWSVVFFAFGSIVGSFLNVCIYRMPRGESVVSPPSHCPHCGYHIPWYLNIPLFTWLYLRGGCANCKAPISVRYFLVELLTAITFLGCWLRFGHASPLQALACCLLLAGFIVATFIDLEHYIIPDEITIGGMAVGFLCSFAVPEMQGVHDRPRALQFSALGIALGAGIIYAIVRGAKLVFGRKRLTLPPDTRLVFGEEALQLPDQEIPYAELFYRKSDALTLHAKSVQMGERLLENVPLRLTASTLQIGEETFDPETVTHLEVVTDAIVMPREAMGLGDVKFMAAIGAFLGWKAIVFSLMLSSAIGSVAGLALVALRKGPRNHYIPYGPYLALAATAWIFAGPKIVSWWFALVAALTMH